MDAAKLNGLIIDRSKVGFDFSGLSDEDLDALDRILGKTLPRLRRSAPSGPVASQCRGDRKRARLEAGAPREARPRRREGALRRRCDGIVYWFNNYVLDLRPAPDRRGARTDREPVHPLRAVAQAGRVHPLAARSRRGNEEWLTEKSRDAGVSYLCCGYALNRWLFSDGFKATFGSRKAEYVDKSGQPDSLFEKIRIMLRRQPEWMLPDGFTWARDSLFMRLVNPATGAIISGEGGEDMGRGGRSSLYIVDEAAFLPNAESVEKALSGNTDCVGWVSSVNGMGNLFARKRHSILKKRTRCSASTGATIRARPRNGRRRRRRAVRSGRVGQRVRDRLCGLARRRLHPGQMG
jgi:hypothetical protein